MSNTTNNTAIMPDNVEFSQVDALKRKNVKNYTAIQYTDGGGKPLSADNLNHSEIALQLFFGIGNKDPANTDIKPEGTIMELFDKINSIITSYNSNFATTKQLSKNILTDMNNRLASLDYNKSSGEHQFVKQVHQTDGKINVEYQQPEQEDIKGLVPRLEDIEYPEYTSSSTLAELTSGEPLSDLLCKIQTAVKSYIEHQGNFENPHNVTAEQVGLGNVENKSTDTIKSEFTGSVTKNNTGFVTGGAAYEIKETISAHVDADNPHKITTKTLGVGKVEPGDTNFVTGDEVYKSIENAKISGGDVDLTNYLQKSELNTAVKNLEYMNYNDQIIITCGSSNSNMFE